MIDKIEIIYEDDAIVVINKPYGLVVNRAESVKTKTLQDWMEERYANVFTQLKTSDTETDQIFLQRSGLAHRLDKDTSGILLLAKNPISLQHLMAQFKNRQIYKEYIAVVHGRFSLKESIVRIPLARIPGNRKRFGVVASGKMTETKLRVIEEFETNTKLYQDGFSVVRFWPKTGRTHQIRVVCKHLQRPIVGDWLYVGRKRAKADATWCNRQCLHAAHIRLTHPETNKEINFDAPIPQDMLDVIKRVKDEQF